MGREISLLLQPKSLLILVVALVLIFFVFSFSQQEEEKVEEMHDITHRVFLDVDIDKQRVGPRRYICPQCFPSNVINYHNSFLLIYWKNCYWIVWPSCSKNSREFQGFVHRFVLVNAIEHIGVHAYFVAAMAWLLLLVVLGFFVHVLDNVIDTVYVCYAIDRYKGDVCKQEVHEVYVHLPISRSHR